MLSSQAMFAEVMFVASSVQGGLHCHSSSHEQRIRGSNNSEVAADEPMSAVAFSGDGSLVAAAVPGSVTLWDPVANALVAVMACPGAASSAVMSSLSFVPGTPYLVSLPRTTKHRPVVPKDVLYAAAFHEMYITQGFYPLRTCNPSHRMTVRSSELHVSAHKL